MSTTKVLLASVLFATAGQILFKQGMSRVGQVFIQMNQIFRILLRIISSPLVMVGLVFYAVSVILWLVALSRSSLNYVYPFAALTFILVMLASHFIFREAVPLTRLAGIVLICSGFILCSLK